MGEHLRDILLYWLFEPRFLAGKPVNVWLEPTTQILATTAGPVIRNFAGYGSGTDWYWEWLAFGDIFPS